MVTDLIIGLTSGYYEIKFLLKPHCGLSYPTVGRLVTFDTLSPSRKWWFLTVRLTSHLLTRGLSHDS